MENLRQILYQFNPNTSIIIGHKYAVEKVKDGYLAGGGYILSRKAVEKFVTNLHSKKCREDDGGSEDFEMGICLQENALFIDGHDEFGEKQFFPVGVTDHMSYNKLDYNYWYVKNQWYNSTQGGLKCCSKFIACMHYIEPTQMYRYNYLINNVYPFGLSKESSQELPKKLTFQELIELADEKSYSPNYVEHKNIHNFDKDEVF